MKLLEQITSKSPLNSLKQEPSELFKTKTKTSKPSTKAKRSFTTSIKGIGLTTFLLLLASINLLTNFLQQLGWAVSSLVVTDWEKWCLSIYSFKYNCYKRLCRSRSNVFNRSLPLSKLTRLLCEFQKVSTFIYYISGMNFFCLLHTVCHWCYVYNVFHWICIRNESIWPSVWTMM